MAGNTAITTNGSTGYVASSTRQASPASFSVEAWFKTTSTSGGKIIGFGDRQHGLTSQGMPVTSGLYDKHLYLTNDGRLVFGVYAGVPDTLTSRRIQRRQWHHVVGSQGPLGLTLYVDGAKVGARRPDQEPGLLRLLAGRRRQPGRLAQPACQQLLRAARSTSRRCMTTPSA